MNVFQNLKKRGGNKQQKGIKKTFKKFVIILDL